TAAGRSILVAGEEGGREGRLVALLAPTAFAALATGAPLPTVAVAPATGAAGAITTGAALAAAPTARSATHAGAARAAGTRPARLARWAGVGQLLAALLIDQPHRQANLAAWVDFEDLDLDLLAFAQDVGDLGDALVLDLRDVDQAVARAHEVHERTEV